jgi:hypothetical protein
MEIANGVRVTTNIEMIGIICMIVCVIWMKKIQLEKKNNVYLPSSSGSGIWIFTTKSNGLGTVHITVDLLFRVQVKARHEIWIKSIDLLLFSSAVHSLHILLLILSKNDVVSFGTTLWFWDVVLRICKKKHVS